MGITKPKCPPTWFSAAAVAHDGDAGHLIAIALGLADGDSLADGDGGADHDAVAARRRSRRYRYRLAGTE
jgi:hypothetical protein